jgi:hypothetical protein
MAHTATGFLAEGARLLARRKAMLAWIYAGYLALGALAALAAAMMVAPVLNRSLYSDRLLNGFDLATLVELLMRPEVRTDLLISRAAAAALVLGIVLLVCMPGIVAELLADERLRTARFFHACGTFLWRFVRLVLLSWLILLPTMAVFGGIRTGLMNLADRSSQYRLPFLVFVTVSVVSQLVGLLLRAWFDAAQCDLVHHQRDTARRALGEARRLTRGYRGQLLGMYLVPGLLAWAGTLLVVALWLRQPPARIGLTILLGQVVIAWWVVSRMWQRAALAAWFKQQQPAPAVIPEIVEAPPGEPAAAPATELDLP